MNTSAYSPLLARRMVLLSAASYCAPTLLQTWSCLPCTDPDFSLHALLEDPDLYLQGFVGIVNSSVSESVAPSSHILLAFRGTISSSLADWISDFKFQQTAPYIDRPDIKVHSGFYAAYTHMLQAQVKAILLELPDLPLILTGHSLGASLAVLCAWDLHVYHARKVAAVYTFGQPRIGNFQFAISYAKLVPNLWRATHAHDIVPHIPPTEQGFYHPQFEIFYPGDDSQYTICDSSGEDDDCSNACSTSLSCTSVSDHLLYLNVSIGSDQCDPLDQIVLVAVARKI
eukprot:CAMPEP_0196585978 /NCGR_PEP_ID=MMETSP1081-20130531/52768_1 /TAXON_ID=36882 /ORGANISM="Pyramimonas amylifera, Strain CCMP720" /LENGTH=284 /DNA_ID=CAMNT_0041907707 /DNA_START=152 /DNA_END=1006 /DNA_ORIENTATION=+